MDMDRTLCMFFGRAPAMREEESAESGFQLELVANPVYSYDVDLPAEVDDEYWVNPDPDRAFTQPAGKPSYVTFFNLILRLGRINSLAIRSMVSQKRPVSVVLRPCSHYTEG